MTAENDEAHSRGSRRFSADGKKTKTSRRFRFPGPVTSIRATIMFVAGQISAMGSKKRHRAHNIEHGAGVCCEYRPVSARAEKNERHLGTLPVGESELFEKFGIASRAASGWSAGWLVEAGLR